MNSAPYFTMPIFSTCSRTPSRSNSGVLIGSIDSPMWKRGWRSLSTTTVFQPRSASSPAAVEPAGPPPRMNTSQVSSIYLISLISPEPLVQAAILPRARRPARRLARFSLCTFYIGIAAGAEFHAHRRAVQLERVAQESLEIAPVGLGHAVEGIAVDDDPRRVDAALVRVAQRRPELPALGRRLLLHGGG